MSEAACGRASLWHSASEEMNMSETTKTRIGYVLSGLFVLFMLGASVTPKLLRLPVVEETMAHLAGRPATVCRSAFSN